MRSCQTCTCTDENACLTTQGACSWVPGSDLCSACLFPSTKLSGPQIEDARTIVTDDPITLRDLCDNAAAGDGDSVRWFWGVYGRELRARLHTALNTMVFLAA